MVLARVGKSLPLPLEFSGGDIQKGDHFKVLDPLLALGKGGQGLVVDVPPMHLHKVWGLALVHKVAHGAIKLDTDMEGQG